jgi:hypothetical protein
MTMRYYSSLTPIILIIRVYKDNKCYKTAASSLKTNWKNTQLCSFYLGGFWCNTGLAAKNSSTVSSWTAICVVNSWICYRWGANNLMDSFRWTSTQSMTIYNSLIRLACCTSIILRIWRRNWPTAYAVDRVCYLWANSVFLRSSCWIRLHP